ncbi:winged helix-turn-helix transcriptional regulator [Iamia sp. SCSIO 61187]|uniref:winged helix-turn-helix domain-containing protein n=1 Tax=Iamia sp. SCSIO 61187 TaxID=2722752 RepID=UPI001C6319F9|nr:winged helix-turn-helix domain-containing protein [Iamia sp. SCSIO 61187]QYG91186.1 winged helix-turn-helix transcriptional regulator [Iamia sp. SCSIO 61187]
MSAPRAAARPRPGTPPSSAAGAPAPDDTRTVIDGIAVLRWPTDAEIRDGLVADGTPRILVVEDDAPPPLVWDRHEDWVRAGSGRAEVEARSARLAARPAEPRPGPVVPMLDADGIVRTADGEWAAIPPVEARLLAPLLDRADHVVHRADLLAAAWPQGGVNQRALDGRMKLLRRRVAPLGIKIHTVRGLGFLLEMGDG